MIIIIFVNYNSDKNLSFAFTVIRCRCDLFSKIPQQKNQSTLFTSSSFGSNSIITTQSGFKQIILYD